MTLKEYQKLCIKSEPPYLTRGDEALLGLMGLNAASGECIKLYKKTLYEGAELDQKGLVDALGWAICNVAQIAHAIDVDLETVLRGNADELAKCIENPAAENSDAGDKEKE